eukprot:g21524.t1
MLVVVRSISSLLSSYTTDTAIYNLVLYLLLHSAPNKTCSCTLSIQSLLPSYSRVAHLQSSPVVNTTFLIHFPTISSSSEHRFLLCIILRRHPYHAVLAAALHKHQVHDLRFQAARAWI